MLNVIALVCLSVSLSVCVVLWALLPELNINE